MRIVFLSCLSKKSFRVFTIDINELPYKIKYIKIVFVLQINRLEASETQLQLQVDDLTDKIEELEEQIKGMKLTERQLRSALVKTENNESELTVQLENTQGEVEVSTKILHNRSFVLCLLPKMCNLPYDLI